MPQDSAPSPPARKKYVPAVGPRLKLVFYFISGLVAVLGANSAYLAAITFLEWKRGQTYQNYFYQYMFLAHLLLGLLLIVPFLVFAAIHIKNAFRRANRRAVRVGYALFAVSLVLLASGVALMRVGNLQLKDPAWRSFTYWLHVITPLMAIWLYILHRLAGPRLKWKIGLRWLVATGAVVLAMAVLHLQDPRQWNQVGPSEGTNYFHPSLARTVSGNFIPARTLMMDSYCLKCHADNYQGWFHSAHHFSSFNNQPYLFSVKETRQVALQRDGNVKAARWCAGCHDVVPFFSGAFDNPNYDLEKDPTSQAGITCTACHAITHINTTRGNADYTIDEPIHYPFAFSSNSVLQFINQQLVKAKPEFHKKTFLKPLHRTSEFCSTCHKVSIPFEVNKYKDFLRGQNHYDSFLLSGVSGHNARSFYYPEHAQPNCAGCHMPLRPSQDFGAKLFHPTNTVLSVHNHLFPAANTGVPYLRKDDPTIAAQQNFLKGTLRADLFGLKEEGSIEGKLLAPLRPGLPKLKKGGRYLLELVVRNLKVGHLFTQGTSDSNEVWVDLTLRSGQRILGRSGGLQAFNGVDPWSHFINTYMLDRHGNRVDRRNPQDIFVPLYNHQIPPGSAQVVHYQFQVPFDLTEPLTVEAKVQYRKFDTTYLQYVFGTNYTNQLPITTLAEDRVTLPLEGMDERGAEPPAIPPWQRWNDYGIALLLEGDRGSEKGELLQASQAFAEVEKLGRADGPLNLARVYLKEGRLEEAVEALRRAGNFDPPGPHWTIAYLNGIVNKQNGFLDEAITQFSSVLNDRYPELDRRGFDFSLDYEVINELGLTLFERAKLEGGSAGRERRDPWLREAARQFQKTLALDPENLTAHYNLGLIYTQLGDAEAAARHRKLHERFRPDDNARDYAISTHRRKNPAADHAAQSIVIYNLQRGESPGALAVSGAPGGSF